MYTVWLFDAQGRGIDYQFHLWYEAIEFMVSLHKQQFSEEIVEWELCCERR